MNRFNEAARYTAPASPFDKFKSDLAREFTAKKFPFTFGSKKDKKCFRTPSWYEHEDGVPSFEIGGGSDELWITIRGHGTGLMCIVSSDGKGEEWFQNTNPYFKDEGYTTDDNFYYQGPTWTVTKYNEDSRTSNVYKSGLNRNEVADAIIEIFKKYGKYDYDDLWSTTMERIKSTISANEENIKKYQGYIDGTIDPGYTLDDWQIARYATFINGWERDIKEYSKYFEAPVLPPDLNDTATIEKKSKKYYLGMADYFYDGRTTYWVTLAFDKRTALSNVKHSMYCSRRSSYGSRKDPFWTAASVKLLKEFNTKEELDEYINSTNKNVTYVS